MIHTRFPRPIEDFRQPYEWIVADPPWPYRNVKTGGSMTSGSAAQYPVMTMDDILNLPVPEIAAKDCCCFLWTTTPLLPQGLAVLDRWGFEYKSALYWDKKNYPLGFWFRGRVEPCLIGIRGTVKAFRSSAVNIIQDEPAEEYLCDAIILEEKARGWRRGGAARRSSSSPAGSGRAGTPSATRSCRGRRGHDPRYQPAGGRPVRGGCSRHVVQRPRPRPHPS